MDWTSDEAGRRRVVIEGVTPEVDGGRFPIKRVVGERVVVEAVAFADGNDTVTCRLLFRSPSADSWSEAVMAPLPGDRWRAEFTVTEQGRWLYTVTGWVERFKTWRQSLERKVKAGEDVSLDLQVGADLMRDAGRRAEGGPRKAEARILAALAQDLETGGDPEVRLRLALDDELLQLMDRHTDRRFSTVWSELAVVVDRDRALFSSWYAVGSGASLRDAEDRLLAVAQMGFDVLAAPPVEPGAAEEVGRFRALAEGQGMEVALDFGDQPVDVESDGWPAVRTELKSAVDSWVAEGVHICRANDPDTRPFPFWEQLIDEVKRDHPDVLFLAGPCSRSHVEARLAKLGFSQSTARLPWPVSGAEIKELLLGFQGSPLAEVLRPNLWLSAHDGSRAVFVQRLLLAATLWPSYGIDAAALDAIESRKPAEGEADHGWSESLRELISLVNRIRRENPALQTARGLRFHSSDNDQILCYSKAAGQGDNTILVALNLDPVHVQSAWVELPAGDFGLPRSEPYQVHDLLTGARYLWHGARNFVRLDPHSIPAHIFRVRRSSPSLAFPQRSR